MSAAPPIKCPTWVSKDAKKHWRTISKQLDEMGLLTSADTVPLGMLCDALAEYIEAKALSAEAGPICESPNGALYQHPAVGIKNKAFERVMRVAKECGMTPAARNNLALDNNNGNEEDKAEEFLN